MQVLPIRSRDTYIYIYQRNSAIQLASVGERERAPIIYTFYVEFWLLIIIKYLRNTLSKQYNKCVDKYYSTCSAEYDVRLQYTTEQTHKQIPLVIGFADARHRQEHSLHGE